MGQIRSIERFHAMLRCVCIVIATPTMVRDAAKHPNASRHYGVLWWTNADGALPDAPRDAHWAWGLGDGLIVVIPGLDVVAVRAGAAWRGGAWTSNYAVVEPFITPIARSVQAP